GSVARGGELPIPLIGTISGALPERGAQVENRGVGPILVQSCYAAMQLLNSFRVSYFLLPRFQAMERQMRSVPGWQPLDEPQAVLPTALEMPEDAAMAARRIDALIVGVLTIGLAVVAASAPVALVSLLAPTGGSSTGPRTKRWPQARGPTVRPDRPELPQKNTPGSFKQKRAQESWAPWDACEGAQEQKDEEEFEMQLGPLKTLVFAVRVYYVCNILFLLAPGSAALTSWSKAENLMLGGAGLAWEVIWLWLVARGPVPTTSRVLLSLSEFQAVLATDVLGYSFRVLQAAWMKRRIDLADPAISIVMSAPASHRGGRTDHPGLALFRVLFPGRSKDCLFAGAVFQLAACQAEVWRRTAGFWVGNAALLTIFLPAPALHGPYLYVLVRNDQECGKCTLPQLPEASRRDLAAEFWPALVARLRVSKERPPQAVEVSPPGQRLKNEQSESDSGREEQTTWEWLAQKVASI
ncbi:unnamed protein product, partial [Symbiodinium necroappetens]